MSSSSGTEKKPSPVEEGSRRHSITHPVYRSQHFDPEKASDMLDFSRDLYEKSTHLLPSPKELKKHPAAMRIMSFSGCERKIGKKR